MERDELGTCGRCGAVVPVAHLTGIGFDGGPLSWLCGPCVVGGGADELFAGLGDRLRALIERDRDRGGGIMGLDP
jgi:hypothetical protein